MTLEAIDAFGNITNITMNEMIGNDCGMYNLFLNVFFTYTCYEYEYNKFVVLPRYIDISTYHDIISHDTI